MEIIVGEDLEFIIHVFLSYDTMRRKTHIKYKNSISNIV